MLFLGLSLRPNVLGVCGYLKVEETGKTQQGFH